jgi:hypothetical protein
MALTKEEYGAAATVVGALIALGGAVITLTATTLRDWITGKENRSREIASLRGAILAELRVMSRVTREEIDFCAENPFTWVPTIDANAVYLANIGQIGSLSPEQAEAVVNAYAVYQERMGYIRTHNQKAQVKALPGHIGINLNDRDNRTLVMGDLEEIDKAATNAITCLERVA